MIFFLVTEDIELISWTGQAVFHYEGKWDTWSVMTSQLYCHWIMHHRLLWQEQIHKESEWQLVVAPVRRLLRTFRWKLTCLTSPLFQLSFTTLLSLKQHRNTNFNIEFLQLFLLLSPHFSPNNTLHATPLCSINTKTLSCDFCCLSCYSSSQ